MSGKLKKVLATLAALGITTSGVIAFLQHLGMAFPNNHRLGQVCVTVATVLGLVATYFPISIKAPDQPQQADIVKKIDVSK